jgi:hypothetical protein
MAEVVWCAPYDPVLHSGMVGKSGRCSWDGKGAVRGDCPNPPYASVKIREDNGDEAVWSACADALRSISGLYGFPIPPSG